MTYTVKEITIDTYQDFHQNTTFTYTVLISDAFGKCSTVGTGDSLKKAIKDALESIESARVKKEMEDWEKRNQEVKRGKTVSKKR